MEPTMQKAKEKGPRKRQHSLTVEERAAVKKYPVQTDEMLAEFVKQWRKGKAFLVSGIVTSPYDGCFYEPNVWIVVPPKCEEHTPLNGNWEPRYNRPQERLRALAEVNERAAEIYREKERLKKKVAPHVEQAGPDWQFIHANMPGASIEEQQLVMDQVRWALLRIKELEAEGERLETNIAEINERFPAKPEPPDSVVFPLYASGQGVAVDVLYTLEDCLFWLMYGELPKDGEGHLRESRIAERYPSWGRFRDFDVRPMGPLSELNVAEHYWATAISIAYKKWDLELPWKCSECGQEIIGTDEDDGSPHFTGYRGNGGIGVFMEGGLCADCFRSGCCKACEAAGGADHDIWDETVFRQGVDLCEWHAEDLAKRLSVSPADWAVLSAMADGTEPVVLCLKQVKEDEKQELVPGVERRDVWVLEDKDGGQMPVTAADDLDDFLRRHDLAEQVDVRWGNGLYVLAEHIAKQMEPEPESEE